MKVAVKLSFLFPYMGLGKRGLYWTLSVSTAFYSLIWDLKHVKVDLILHDKETFYSLIWDFYETAVMAEELGYSFLFPYMGFKKFKDIAKEGGFFGDTFYSLIWDSLGVSLTPLFHCLVSLFILFLYCLLVWIPNFLIVLPSS